MAKAISSATEFLTAIAGKTTLFEVEGVTIELRSLGHLETEMLMDKYGDKPLRLALEAARLGIANPVLDEEQLESMGKALPGVIEKLSREVMRISGMSKESDSPLAGSGSSALPVTGQPA